MAKNEIAEIMAQDGLVFETACRTKYNMSLTSEQKDVAEVVDQWAKQIGERGADPECELSAFIIKTLEPVVYDEDSELEAEDVLGKIERFFTNIFDEDVDAGEYLVTSFEELDNKQKTILILLLVLIAIGLISKLFSKKKTYDSYEEEGIENKE